MPTRDEAIRILEGHHDAVTRLIDRLDADAFVRRATIGGGDWSAKDLLAHLTTWEEIALRTIDEWRRGERPRIEEAYRAEDVDRINEEAVARKGSLPADEVRAEAKRVHDELLAAIRGSSEEEWSSRARYETERRTSFGALLGSLLGAPRRPFGHAIAHLADLEAYVASNPSA